MKVLIFFSKTRFVLHFLRNFSFLKGKSKIKIDKKIHIFITYLLHIEYVFQQQFGICREIKKKMILLQNLS